jgi:hypothetical protein
VKRSAGKILEGQNAGETVEADHGDWYREMFGPSVTVGILKPSDLAGYRNQHVYIGQSKHTPMIKDAVRDVMPILFELLASGGDPWTVILVEERSPWLKILTPWSQGWGVLKSGVISCSTDPNNVDV